TPIVLPIPPRPLRRCSLGLPQGLPPAAANILRASRVGGASSPGARTFLPGDPGRLFAEPPPVFRSAGPDRDVPDRRSGHTNDHGVAEAGPGIPSVLHLRRDVPRLSGRPRGATCG